MKSAGLRLPESTNSPETMSTARHWIDTCKSRHRHCNSSLEPGQCPTRLLDCGPFGDPSVSCRLIETGTTNLKEPYMTLSHCWGNVDCLKLTMDNYAQFLQGIPPDSLPLLYRDAIHTTLSLGQKYLWIDSLCIIQQGDNQQDWKSEVKLMSQVYSNSYCTISAKDTPNGHHTMFATRNPDAIRPFQATKGGTRPYHLLDIFFWTSEISHSLINTRGWVFQERLLAPCVLYFGQRQIFWECRESTAAETYPRGVTGQWGAPETLQFKKYLSNTAVSATDAYSWWEEVVSTYTACKLTFPADKLVAISAVARVLATLLKDEYVAGMWRRNLQTELLWYTKNPQPRPKLYRAPSWSWASVDGKISRYLWDPEHLKSWLFDVKDLELEYPSDDKTASICGGWLQLRGLLRPCMLERQVTAHANRGMRLVLTNGVQFDTDASGVLDALDDDFDNLQETNHSLYCIPAAESMTNFLFMLLLSVVDPEKGVYRRVGIFDCHCEEYQVARLMEPVLGKEMYPCEEYEGGRHLIRII